MDYSSPASRRAKDVLFWLAVAALVLFRFALGSDLSVQINYSPHDDSLYVERAFHLLAGEAFGPYDSRVLVKYPGISFWLAGARSLGIPFLLSINVLYVAAGAYLLLGMRRCGVGRLVLLAAFALLVFNPISLGYEWVRVIREPLATSLVMIIVAAVVHIYAGVAEGRHAWRDLAILAPTFAFALFVREDDLLLWALLALFAAGLLWQMARARALATRTGAVFLAAAILVPPGAAMTYERWLRSFVERSYGAPVLHELSEGEFPRLMAAIRSIESRKDNRLVMVTQEALAGLRREVPRFAPVIDRLPPPGPGTESCRRQGVCSEWSNGWMPFWIKDESYRAGLTPDLPAAQDYFRRVREDIESACAKGRLRCRAKGEALVPPMELRWTRAYVEEGYRLAKMTFWPEANVIGSPPLLYDVPVDLGRIFQAVTMTGHFDSQWQTNFADRPTAAAYVNPLAGTRTALAKPVQSLAAALLGFALALLAHRLWIANRAPLGPFETAAAVFGLYSLFRLAVLSYVAVYMGRFDSRMIFSTYTLGVILALPFIQEVFLATRAGRASETEKLRR